MGKKKRGVSKTEQSNQYRQEIGRHNSLKAFDALLSLSLRAKHSNTDGFSFNMGKSEHPLSAPDLKQEDAFRNELSGQLSDGSDSPNTSASCSESSDDVPPEIDQNELLRILLPHEPAVSKKSIFILCLLITATIFSQLKPGLRVFRHNALTFNPQGHRQLKDALSSLTIFSTASQRVVALGGAMLLNQIGTVSAQINVNPLLNNLVSIKTFEENQNPTFYEIDVILNLTTLDDMIERIGSAVEHIDNLKLELSPLISNYYHNYINDANLYNIMKSFNTDWANLLNSFKATAGQMQGQLRHARTKDQKTLVDALNYVIQQCSHLRSMRKDFEIMYRISSLIDKTDQEFSGLITFCIRFRRNHESDSSFQYRLLKYFNAELGENFVQTREKGANIIFYPSAIYKSLALYATTNREAVFDEINSQFDRLSNFASNLRSSSNLDVEETIQPKPLPSLRRTNSDL